MQSAAKPARFEVKSQNEIKTWLDYWNQAGMVAVDEIRAFDQVHTARKFCACMRTGVFADVTDLAIWRALLAMRCPECA
jgi:tRNA(Leu) C34 or U34 (ribose-2'-O)-methylase TrmL